MQRLHYRQKQLIRAKNAGASIVLLIVAALEPARFVALYQEAEALGLKYSLRLIMRLNFNKPKH